MKKARRIDVNLEELGRVLDGAREAPLSESDHSKLRNALHALAELRLHKQHSWLEAQFAERRTEPNSGARSGDRISASAQAASDVVPPQSRGPAGQ